MRTFVFGLVLLSVVPDWLRIGDGEMAKFAEVYGKLSG